jgi:hypothetical protein
MIPEQHKEKLRELHYQKTGEVLSNEQLHRLSQFLLVLVGESIQFYYEEK